MKIMRIHFCIACKYCKYFMETAPIRAKCCDPKAKTKKGQPRILNKRLITLGHFPKWCPLEDADFGVLKEADRGYCHEKTI